MIKVIWLESKVPINEMASSLMARRTFIGNIYKLVKDPNLVSALTGHAEGSRAFNRYRDIDIDMKRDLVKIMEGKRWRRFLFDWHLTERLKTAFDSEFIANLQ